MLCMLHLALGAIAQNSAITQKRWIVNVPRIRVGFQKMCWEVGNPRSSIPLVYCRAFQCLKGVVNSSNLVAFIFSTKEVLKPGKEVYSGSGERSFPSEVLARASWRCGGHAGPLHREDILTAGPEVGRNRVGSRTSWHAQGRKGVQPCGCGARTAA